MDPVGDVEKALRRAIGDADRATTALEGIADHEHAASIGAAILAARFNLGEALRRLER